MRRSSITITVAASPYRAVREVFDTAEATLLLNHGWHLEEVRTLSKWSRGHHSQTTTYLVGLPRNAHRDVEAVSLPV